MPTNIPSDVRKHPHKVILVSIPAIQEVEIKRLEKKLGLNLPGHDRQFLLNYPSELIETKLDMEWCHESISDRKLRFNLDELGYYNQDVRKSGTPWTEDDGPWPDRYFVIGDDQCGNYWVIDLESKGREVLFYDHDEGSFAVVHKTIEGFAKDLVRSTKKWNREKRSNHSQ